MYQAVNNRKFFLDPRGRLEEKIRLMDLDPAWTPNAGRRLRAQWWWRYGEHYFRRPLRHHNARDPERVLRVGYVSGDYNLHSACTVFGPIALAHSARFQTYCYSTTPPGRRDPATDYFAANSMWRDVWGWRDETVAAQIVHDQIDVLVDCSGFTPNNRLPVFAMRAAPVQVNAWGYVYPTTFPCFDAIFTDAVCVHEDEREGIEPVVELPCALYYADREVLIEPNVLPCLSASPVFGTYNRIAKIDDHYLKLVARILDAVPGSKFILKTGDTEFTQKHIHVAHMLGAERTMFLPATTTQQHAAEYARLDLNLDPIAQNGGVTSLESLWMGVPMVTLPGGQTPTRISASLLHAVGLDGFTATSDDEYVNMAVQWVTTRRDELATIRAGLRARMRASPLCAGYVDAVEQAYRNLWIDWCKK
jgi:predicted O-linked N-acetylglucosamine transferase (SPINDLY family)